ncbi:hypothetical protein PGT21_025258 [Puccinia graminis f. sp. tritici]|uniref:Uncharacterized protein n=2 Tax=Puccinia graminis f. sp. tritici TaxID=56615 RepID=A0A5B0QJH0_PUCGR|nr:hypothetical protein PGT21_025258 [Puccinia graminis f. sp. tritici]
MTIGTMTHRTTFSFDKNYHPHKTELTRISNRALLVVSDSIDRQIRAWNSGKLFKPTYRKNITNFVFIGAFVSACFCVGAQSFFPDAGFHSNYLKLHPLQNNVPREDEIDDLDRFQDTNHSLDRILQPQPQPAQSLFCPAPFLRFFGLVESSNTNSHQSHSRQRRWIQEESP